MHDLGHTLEPPGDALGLQSMSIVSVLHSRIGKKWTDGKQKAVFSNQHCIKN